jgi:hypothetical protein
MVRDRLKASQVLHPRLLSIHTILTDFTFEFIRRPISPILSPSSRTFVELTLVIMSAYSRTRRVTHLTCIDARIEWIIGYWVFFRSLGWNPRHHERFRNGPKNKIHIMESSFWVSEKFWTFSVEYRNVLESSGGLHGGAHMPQRVHMDQRVLPTRAWSSMPICPMRPRAKP